MPEKRAAKVKVEDDFLLEEVVQAEADDRGMDDAIGYVKPPHLDVVQLRLEKTIMNFCLDEGFQPYGVVIDAVKYILKGGKLVTGYFRSPEARNKFPGKASVDIANEVIIPLAEKMWAALDGVSKEYKIDPETSLTLLPKIYGRYRRHSQHHTRRKHGVWSQKKIKDEKHPYETLWTPWFRKLKAKWDYYKTEPNTKSVI